MNHLKKPRQSRRFLGNTINPTAFDKAHLKAYLKGKKIFSFGFDPMAHPALKLENRRQKYPVLEKYID